MNMTVTQTLAQFIVGLKGQGAIPMEVMEKARVSLLNGYGIGLACFNTPYAAVAAQAALAIDGECSDGATLLTDGRKTSMLGATLANCALFHGRAQEDACGAAHLGPVMIPLLTAAVECRRMPVERLLPALVAGYEVGGLMEAVYAPHSTPAGVRATPTYGALAAAAAAAYALDLDEAKTAAALANAASFAGGTLQSFADGTDEWRYQLGVAARNGWVAAELARAGSVSAPRAIEGKSGFVCAYARTECDADALLGQLGKTWMIHKVMFKPYPVCAFNQSPVAAALRFRERLKGRLPSRIRVRMNPYETGYAGMDSKGPFHSVSGTLMSIPFCIAQAIEHGAPTLKHMMVYDDPEVLSLIKRIDLVTDASINRLCCVIEADFDDGSPQLVESLVMSAADYNYPREAVRALIVRVCAEVGVSEQACAQFERFVDDPLGVGIQTVLAQFAELRQSQA